MIGSAEIGRVEVEKVAMPVGHAAGAGRNYRSGAFREPEHLAGIRLCGHLAMSTTARSTSFQGAVLPKLIVEPRIEPEIVFGLSRDG